MAWTKRALIEAAYAELALASYDFDLSPEEMLAGLRRLDSMMATWAGQGVQVGYVLGTSPDAGSIDDDSGLQSVANEAVYMSLACRIAAGKGKVLAPSTLRNAKQAYDSLLSHLASQQVQRQQLPSGTPLGAGNKPWRMTTRPFVSRPDTGPLRTDGDGGLDLTGA